MRLVDLTGEKFGRLTVIQKAEGVKTKSGRALTNWICLCECGNEVTVLGENLKKGRTRSCGCLAKEHQREHGKTINLKHGQNHKNNPTPEYRAWQSMIQRCENPNCHAYGDYGGRGISICKEWRESFEHFYRDMGPKPSHSHSLDRIDVNGNYEPGNCRWANKATQSRNVRHQKSNILGIKGVRVAGEGRFIATIGVHSESVYLGTFPTLDQAINARKKAEKEYWGSE